MNIIEQIQNENDNFISNISYLAQTEDSRAEVVSAVFVRSNSDLRFKNQKEIREDIHTRSKNI